MLVCQSFESIGRHKRQDGSLGFDRCNVLPHLIVSRTMSPLHTRITNASLRAQSPSWKTTPQGPGIHWAEFWPRIWRGMTT